MQVGQMVSLNYISIADENGYFDMRLIRSPNGRGLGNYYMERDGKFIVQFYSHRLNQL